MVNRTKRYDVVVTEAAGRVLEWTKFYEGREEARTEALREFPAAVIVTVVSNPEDEARAA